MGKKDLLARFLYWTRVYHVMRWACARQSGNLKILAYHRICDTDEINDPELVSASRNEFQWQVSYIKRYYHPMTFEAVVECFEQNRKLPRNAIVITFDDGFADNYHNAFEILRNNEVPATFFISTDYLDSGEEFWFNRVSRIIMSNPGRDFYLDGKRLRVDTNSIDRRYLVGQVLLKCKQVSDSRRREIVDQLATDLGDNGACDSLSRPMSWSEVREMSAQGMEFGSHSRSHPVLARVNRNELKNEIEESKRIIENQIRKPVLVFSYPDGGEDAVNEAVLDAVRNAGYQLATSYISGSNRVLGVGEFMLRRIHVERYTDRSRFVAALILPRYLA